MMDIENFVSKQLTRTSSMVGRRPTMREQEESLCPYGPGIKNKDPKALFVLKVYAISTAMLLVIMFGCILVDANTYLIETFR